MADSSFDRSYNILPVDDPTFYHTGMSFTEVKAAITSLKLIEGLLVPSDVALASDMDVLDWLGGFFGFQTDNVRNQGEHLVLLLANRMMQLYPAPTFESLEMSVVRKTRKRLSEAKQDICDERRELMYISLYLLIWGEAANLRFMPECLCFIYHHMLGELNSLFEMNLANDPVDVAAVMPTYAGCNGFLNHVVPFYSILKAEADSLSGGTAPHSSWRNNDNLNEYFWRM